MPEVVAFMPFKERVLHVSHFCNFCQSCAGTEIMFEAPFFDFLLLIWDKTMTWQKSVRLSELLE